MSDKLTSKSDILTIQDIEYKTVESPFWKDGIGNPVKFRIKTLMAREMALFEGWKDLSDEQKQINQCRFISLCVVDENGDRMFSDVEAKVLSHKSARAINWLWVECMNFNYDVEAKKN